MQLATVNILFIEFFLKMVFLEMFKSSKQQNQKRSTSNRDTAVSILVYV